MGKEGYANWMWEMWREQKGLEPDDESKDEEILEEQKIGKKISKSEMK